MAYRRESPASLALTPEAQNEVNAPIESAGLDTSEFTWTVRPSEYCLKGTLVSALIYTPTRYFFRFEFLGKNRVSVWTNPSRPNGRKAAATWGDLLGHIRDWLKRISGK